MTTRMARPRYHRTPLYRRVNWPGVAAILVGALGVRVLAPPLAGLSLLLIVLFCEMGLWQ